MTDISEREKECRALYDVGIMRLHAYLNAQTPQTIAQQVNDEYVRINNKIESLKLSILDLDDRIDKANCECSIRFLEKDLAACKDIYDANITYIRKFLESNNSYTGQCFHPFEEKHDGQVCYLYCKYCPTIHVGSYQKNSVEDVDVDVDKNMVHWITPYHIIHGYPHPTKRPNMPVEVTNPRILKYILSRARSCNKNYD